MISNWTYTKLNLDMYRVIKNILCPALFGPYAKTKKFNLSLPYPLYKPKKFSFSFKTKDFSSKQILILDYIKISESSSS